MNTSGEKRLKIEYKLWPFNHPSNFLASPITDSNGCLNFLNWECWIPGKKNTPWEDQRFALRMIFNENYPCTPPKCIFNPVIFHPNVGLSGVVWCNTLNKKNDWQPSCNIKQLLVKLQHLIFNPDERNIANMEPGFLYLTNKEFYWKTVKQCGFYLHPMHSKYAQQIVIQEAKANAICLEPAEEKVNVDYTNKEKLKCTLFLGENIKINPKNHKNIDDFYKYVESLLNSIEIYINETLDKYLAELKIFIKELDKFKKNNKTAEETQLAQNTFKPTCPQEYNSCLIILNEIKQTLKETQLTPNAKD